MTNNQVSSALQAVDELQQLKDVSCLVEVAYEQLDNPLDEHEKTILRCQILLREFLSSLNCHLENLELYTRRMLE